jgi:iron-sulfur cluster assembly protein
MVDLGYSDNPERSRRLAFDRLSIHYVNSFCPGLEPGCQERIMALPGFKVVTLTDAAANRVKDIISKADRPIVGVRVGVKNGGCAGMSYTMEYAESVNPLDEVVEDKGVTVLIDPKAVLFLLGTEMDFQTTKMSSQFVFNNPNQTSACGCGESVAITPATPPALQSAG